MPVSSERFYALLAAVVQNEGAANVSVVRYPSARDGTVRASVKVNGTLEHWEWMDLQRQWLRVV
jgi:hypothetical protein